MGLTCSNNSSIISSNYLLSSRSNSLSSFSSSSKVLKSSFDVNLVSKIIFKELSINNLESNILKELFDKLIQIENENNNKKKKKEQKEQEQKESLTSSISNLPNRHPHNTHSHSHPHHHPPPNHHHHHHPHNHHHQQQQREEIEFQTFLNYFEIISSPFNLQLFSLWKTEKIQRIDYLFFICMIWYSLTMDNEDIVAYIFTSYSHPKTKKMTTLSIQYIIESIHIDYQTNKSVQKVLKILQDSSLNTFGYDEWLKWCESYPIILEPIYNQQIKLRTLIGGTEMWESIIKRKESNPSQNTPHYTTILKNVYDEATLKNVLTTRLLDLTLQTELTPPFKLDSPVYNKTGYVIDSNDHDHDYDNDNDFYNHYYKRNNNSNEGNNNNNNESNNDNEEYPTFEIRTKPSSRSISRTSSLSGGSLGAVVAISGCSTPFSVAEVVLHDKMYDSDGDSVSLPSVGSGKCSEFEDKRKHLPKWTVSTSTHKEYHYNTGPNDNYYNNNNNNNNNNNRKNNNNNININNTEESIVHQNSKQNEEFTDDPYTIDNSYSNNDDIPESNLYSELTESNLKISNHQQNQNHQQDQNRVWLISMDTYDESNLNMVTPKSVFFDPTYENPFENQQQTYQSNVFDQLDDPDF